MIIGGLLQLLKCNRGVVATNHGCSMQHHEGLLQPGYSYIAIVVHNNVIDLDPASIHPAQDLDPASGPGSGSDRLGWMGPAGPMHPAGWCACANLLIHPKGGDASVMSVAWCLIHLTIPEQGW